ncbi:MAG: 3-deoxy-D-manno-octulosonic acid transferase [Acinetobacter sp.]|nr:3-deoxy-D-manno-octulosonic acid transferase [Acinetobacter sp.]
MATPFWYNALLQLIQPLYRWRIKKRAESQQQYQLEIQQRFGDFLPPLNRQAIWIHAVSVGETNAVQAVVEHYLQQGHAVLLTNTTKTGQARAKQLFAKEPYLHLFQAVYLPVDLKRTIHAFLDLYQPKLLALVETELWANLLHQAQARQIPCLLLNARLSAKSAKAYGKVPSLTHPMLQQLNALLAQDDATKQRFISLGMPAERILVLGNLKFDMQVPAHFIAQAEQLKQQWQLETRQIMLLASTHAPEEREILTALKPYLQQNANALCIVVPRHPERFDEVMQQCQQLQLRTQRRSFQQEILPDTQVYLADSMGEMWLWYALSQSCYVGGSLNEVGGGHNILEPMLLHVPTMIGYKYFNFQQIVDELAQQQGIKIVHTAQQAAEALYADATNPAATLAQVQAANRVVQHNQGALQRHLDIINRYLA